VKTHTTKTLMAWLFGQLRPYKLQVVYAMLALIVGAVSWLVLGQGVKYLVDQGFIANNTNQDSLDITKTVSI
jgi:ATP-binding cassette subfamily B protein